MKTWRLIPLLAASGQVQMAIDRWLLQQHQQGLLPSTLRFYTWSLPAISLGYHQPSLPQWQHLTWKDKPLELVRRPTGGRAVLHQGDLTYAVVTSELKGSRFQVYQTLCEFLIQGWRSLGVELHYGVAGRGYIHNPNCFGTATSADLVLADGAKLIGSAQLKRGRAILQHGSIQLEPDAALFAQVFGANSFSPIQLPLSQRGEALIHTVSEALLAAASRCFGAQLSLQPLSDLEWKAILNRGE
ncbi:biotin/lipoate A/B protein ligase family protein [Chroococcidiopsis sp. CCMEE 29]|uniref:lipoyl protein ligase domain-containing protein n=1 Tax=Chroococcidiopsis sp. CCMEE 29 TaxID=155894 RepID=UPI0020213CD2|nr:biotin/lipoate A/B protein ligase family protein [Chroococcidiopsis sp. CCMEE 29]